jgi:hypothetical protein
VADKFNIVAELAALQAEDQRKARRMHSSLASRSLHRGCEAYDNKTIRQAKRDLIAQANGIIEEYRQRRYTLTLRQLFYQFVSRELLPNAQKEYDRLGGAISDGRNLGLIPWDMIEDRTRHRKPLVESSRTDADEIMRGRLETAAYGYRENLWESQKYRPEVWVEKDALIDVVRRGCTHNVPHFSTRGYCSEPLLHSAGKHFTEQLDRGFIPVVLPLADHDSSGIQMTQDIRDKLWKFCRGTEIEVRRIGLNQEQALAHRLPPNLVKDTDTRSAAYEEDYGNECWELDALDPDVIVDLVRDELGKIIDEEAWKKAEEEEEFMARSVRKTGAVIAEYAESILWFARRKRFDDVARRWEARA